MRTRAIRTGAAIFAGTLLAFGAGVPASAGKPKMKAKSTVTADFGATKAEGVNGRVKSREVCEGGRRVVLVERQDTGMISRGPAVKTNDRGRYEFGVQAFDLSSTYWVEVTKRERARVICGGDRSPNFYEPSRAR